MPITLRCEVCKGSFKVKPSKAKDRRTCSISCSKVQRQYWMTGKGNHQYGLKGKKNSSWKSDRRISSLGYILVRHSSSTRSDGFVLEHILVMEQALGRKITAKECVHHKNGNRQDNPIENLELLLRRDHSALHAKERDQPRDGNNGRFIKT